MTGLRRKILFTVGVLSVGLGFLGVFLPLLPTTPFIVLAAWCFFHSSPRAYEWLHRQPYIGPLLSDWETRRAIPRKAKIISSLIIGLSLVFIWGFLPIVLIVKVFLTFILITVTGFILTRPE